LHPDEVAVDKMLALFGGFAARGLVDVDALQVRYSRPRQLELAAGRTVVLPGGSRPSVGHRRPDDLTGHSSDWAGASTRRRSPDCAKVPTRGEPSWMPDEAWQEWPAAGEAEAWERRSSTMVSGE
jgi:hypothetical protein